MNFFLINATILSIIISISAYQPHFYRQYEAAQSEKLPTIIRMNQYLTGRFEHLNKLNSHDYYGNDEDYEKVFSSSTDQASVSTSVQPTVTTPVSNTTDIFDEIYDKAKDTKGQYEDEQEDDDEGDYEKDQDDKADSEADDEKKDADDDEYNSVNQNKPKENEFSIEKLLKSIKKLEKSETYDDEKDDEKDDESESNNDVDDDDDDKTDEDFDYTTQANDAEKDQDDDEDEDEDYQKENKNSKQVKSVINNILDFIQLDRLLSSVSDIFKQSSQPAKIDSNEQEPTKKKKSFIVVLFSNKTKQPKPSSLSSSSDYEQKTVIRSSASKFAKDCSNESIQINILRTVTKVSLFLASATLCVLILLTLLRFCLIRSKKSSSSDIGYNKLENIDTILEKV